jgi:hypothetical protein
MLIAPIPFGPSVLSPISVVLVETSAPLTAREERRMLRLAYPRAVTRWWFIESVTATAIFSAGGRKKKVMHEASII